MNHKPRRWAEAEKVRRRLAAAYRKRAAQRRWTPAERMAFARIAEQWEKTLEKFKYNMC